MNNILTVINPYDVLPPLWTLKKGRLVQLVQDADQKTNYIYMVIKVGIRVEDDCKLISLRSGMTLVKPGSYKVLPLPDGTEIVIKVHNG